MNSEEKEQLALDYVLGALSEEESARVNALLADDPILEDSIRAYREIIAGERILSLQKSSTAPDFTEKIMGRIEREDITVEAPQSVWGECMEFFVDGLRSLAECARQVDAWLHARKVYRGAALTGVLIALITSVFPDSPTSAQKAGLTAQNFESQADGIEVLVPIRSIAAGQPLQPQMFSRVRLSIDEAALGENVAAGWVRDFSQVSSGYARSLIVAGQPLHFDLVERPQAVSSLSVPIPIGYRLASIAAYVEDEQLTPEQGKVRVNVLWRSTYDGLTENPTPVLSDVTLLTIQAHDTSPAGVPPLQLVTVLVPEYEAPKLKFAETSGVLIVERSFAAQLKTEAES